MSDKPHKPHKPHKTENTEKPQTPARAVGEEQRLPLLARWVDWWPNVFGIRLPELWANTVADGIRVEEYVDDDTLVIRAEIPGVDAEDDIEIDVDRGRLSIRAHREHREEARDDRSFRSEFHYG